MLTGDFRAQTFGPFEATLEGLAACAPHLKGPVYGVLGNHDSIRMVPGMEEMGIRMLLNEAGSIRRGDQRIHLAGIDDAHYFRVDNIEKRGEACPTASSRSCCPIRRRSIARPPMPISICC